MNGGTAWRPLLPLALLLPACVLGQARKYDFQENLPNREVSFLHELLEKHGSDATLEEKIYSVPLLPLYYEDRTTDTIYYPGLGKHFRHARNQGALATLLFRSRQMGVYDLEGFNRQYEESRSWLAGILWKDWSGWKGKDRERAAKPYEGWSILFGLVGHEVENGEATTRILWIPF